MNGVMFYLLFLLLRTVKGEKYLYLLHESSRFPGWRYGLEIGLVQGQ